MAKPVLDAATLDAEHIGNLNERLLSPQGSHFGNLSRGEPFGARLPSGSMPTAIELVFGICRPRKMEGVDTAKVPIAARMAGLWLLPRVLAVCQFAHETVRHVCTAAVRKDSVAAWQPAEGPDQAIVVSVADVIRQELVGFPVAPHD